VHVSSKRSLQELLPEAFMTPLTSARSGSVLQLPTILTLLALAVGITTGCGGTGSSGSPALSGNTSVTVVLSSTANDQLSEFDLVLQNLTLTSKTGKTVTLLSTPQGFEFIHLNGQAEPLTTVTIPQGIYASATATIGYSQFTCLTLTPSGGLDSSTFAYGYVPTPNVTLNLASPITITGSSMGLSLDLQVAQSAIYSSCYSSGADPYAITPTFNVTPVAFSTQPTNPENGKVAGLRGQITAIGSNSFTVSVSEGDASPRSVSMNSGSGTLYQGVSGFSALTVGTFVDMDAALEPDGLLARRVAVEDASAVNVISGPLMFVDKIEPALNIWGRDEQGGDYVNTHALGGLPFSFDSAVFQISGQFTNLQNLPFVPNFTGSNMVAGQNLYLSAPKLTDTSNPYTELRTITLIPQTINGTVLGVSTSGGFTDLTVALASDDLFPTLAIQQGQTALLTNPSQVEVYADSNAQLLNTQPLAAGSMLRFYGLVFNDNGTLRMDCAQMNDGVTASSVSNSRAHLEPGAAQTVRHPGPGGMRPMIAVVTRSHQVQP
jgi:hypothetical protein